MREPYHLTLFEYAIMLDLRRINTIVEMGERLDLAGLVSYAFNKPSDLQKVEFEFKKLAGLLQPRDDVLKRAKQMHEALKKQGVI